MHLNHFEIEWLKSKMLQNIIESRTHFLMVSQVKREFEHETVAHVSPKRGRPSHCQVSFVFLIPVGNAGNMPK